MFDRIAVLDWSAAGKPVTGENSIWLAVWENGEITTRNIPTRAEAEATLVDLMAQEGRLFIGADFVFGAPKVLAHALTGQASALALWDWLAERVTDTDQNRTNYRDVAALINRQFPGEGPFWGNGTRTDVPGLPRTRPELPPGLERYREAELAGREGGAVPKPLWQLAGIGAVGAQSLIGQAMLSRLRAKGATVWPYEPLGRVVLSEVYLSFLAAEVAADPAPVKDEAQVRLLATALGHLSEADWAALMPSRDAAEEGWILGAGDAMRLRRALPATALPPRLRDDCFAMPQGVSWVPVDEALSRLKDALGPVVPRERVAVADASGRVLAEPPVARRANPPAANSAVDGYGCRVEDTLDGVTRLPLVSAPAAAGRPALEPVPKGAAIRILTGAVVPLGVEAVVLDEDCVSDGASVTFDGPLKRGANIRPLGEDVAEEEQFLPAGHRFRAQDLAILSATGVAEIEVFRPLRVGVLSTGDEVLPAPDIAAEAHQIWDANRPMLLAMAKAWGCAAVDLGHVKDSAKGVSQRLRKGAERCDLILTSGGASAGDEDHVSKVLARDGVLSSWRIALKPGRPLVLAMFNGVPVLGLPGNPVAAFVCALIFGKPAVDALSGAGWSEPLGFMVPAAFSKRKKPGRREFLRARIVDGRAEVFQSEGSGRISGLAWSDGLVELPDSAAEIAPGDMVRFLPFGSFGL